MPADPIVRTYDPKAVIITFGALIVTGYVDGTYLTAAYDGDQFEKIRGTDGGVDRINKNINDLLLTLTIKQTSPTNTALTEIARQDRIANLGVLPFLVKELNGTTLISAPQAWIKKQADVSYGSGIEGREWTFDTGPAEMSTGGVIL